MDADRQSDGSEGPTVRSFAIYDPTQTISGHGVLKASEVLAWREDDDARISNSLKDSLSGGAWPNTWQDTEQSVRSLCEIKQKLKDGRPIRVMNSHIQPGSAANADSARPTNLERTTKDNSAQQLLISLHQAILAGIDFVAGNRTN